MVFADLQAQNLFAPLHGYGGLLLSGLWRTLFIALLSYGLGLMLGLGLALGAVAGGRGLKLAISTYNAVLRGLPELILILLLYYTFSDALTWVLARMGFGNALDGTQAAIIVLALVTSAYACEVFRAGINAVPRGQIEAGYSLGMGRITCFWRITFPAMLPNALPGLSNIWLMVVKGTSLVSIVGVTELALAAEQSASATKAYFAIYFAALLLYLSVTLLTLRLFRFLEQRLRRGQVAA